MRALSVAAFYLASVLFSNFAFAKFGTARRPRSACTHGSQTFTYTGTDQTFTPPPGCKTFTVKMWGAGGAGVANLDGYGRNGAGGGFVTGVIGVTESTYTIIVGQGGEQSTSAKTRAYGGGGNGGNVGGGGGGRSAVRVGSTDILTAGGGGGGGYGQDASVIYEHGGEGGGTTGLWSGSTQSGQPGTPSAGGAGVGSAQAGSQYQGGDSDGSFAGGGGGGWFGGGGGVSAAGDAGGGGGGSSYHASPNVTLGSTTPGSGLNAGLNSDPDYVSGVGVGTTPPSGGDQRGGNGRVVISY